MKIRPEDAIRRRRQAERGATLVETSIVMLLFLTVMFGLIELGRLSLAYITISEAVRAGVRYAIVHGADRTGSGVDGPSGPGDYTQVSAVVQGVATAAGFSIVTPTVTYGALGNAVGSTVRVYATYTFTPIVTLIPLTTALSSAAEGTICY
jgi:Flp pilus assembly protein TadG